VETEKGRVPGKRVVVHTPEPKASAALYVYEFVKAVHDSGVDVVLFCPANFEYAAGLQASGIELLQAPVRPVSPAGLIARLWRNADWVARTAALQLRKTRAGDVFHFQFLIHLPLGFVFLLLARIRGAHVVFTAHDPLPHKWRLPARLRWLERKMLGWAYGVCDEVVVHNQVGKSVLMSEFQYPAARIAIIPHGPLAPAPEVESYPDCSVMKLLLFGSIRENKGVHLAIEAVQKLRHSAGLPVHLTIAGSVTAAHQEYWQDCQNLISLDASRIEVIERYFEDSELAPLFSSHHAILMPYLDFFSESGVASLALSCQRPLIATAAGGLGELLEESGGGILIGSPSTDGIVKGIEEAMSLGANRLQQLGMAGGQYLRAFRSWRAIGERTRNLYLGAGSATASAGNLAA
jgi:glycosyltransferase involved in cell wall biosynthesis